MWIKVRAMSGGRDCRIDGLSKLTKIEDVRRKIPATMHDNDDLQPECLRLFFKGKELIDTHTLYDYEVGIDACIQLLVRKPKKEEENNNDDDSGDKLQTEKDEEAEKDTKADDDKDVDKDIDDASYKLGELVDVRDTETGAWFEAEVVGIKNKRIPEPTPTGDAPTGEDPTGDAPTGDDPTGDTPPTPPRYSNDGFTYVVKYESYEQTDLLPSSHLRPIARQEVPFRDLKEGETVLLNYNVENPDARGFWYDCAIKAKTAKGLEGVLFAGSDLLALEVSLPVKVSKMFHLETRATAAAIFKDGRPDSAVAPETRPHGAVCESCAGNARKKCKTCGCAKCGGKDKPDQTIICDECEDGFHLWCVSPPLEAMPDDDEWFCPACRNDKSEIVQAGEGLKTSKKRANMPSMTGGKTRDWGRGMATQGVTTKCTIVPKDYFGAIPGVEVGTSWLYRIDCCASGVHRPPVAGIAGTGSLGSPSVVLAGGYEDDNDNGEEFTYTGAGGRDLSGNKRTAEQSFDQKLDKTNLALAKNCAAKLNVETGADAGSDWQKGKPLRVVRSYKGHKHAPDYAPEEGNRYDGIYRVVKYWAEKGQAGFKIWRYLMRRDDPVPAPWTKAGQKRIRELGIEKMIVPPGYEEKEAEKRAEKEREKGEKKRQKSKEAKEEGEEEEKDGKKKRKRKIESDSEEDEEETDTKRTKVQESQVIAFKPDKKLAALIEADILNQHNWAEVMAECPKGRPKFVETTKFLFHCVCCQDVVVNPVTTECKHNTCRDCLKRSFGVGVTTCPVCRHELNRADAETVNKDLKAILNILLPGYEL